MPTCLKPSRKQLQHFINSYRIVVYAAQHGLAGYVHMLNIAVRSNSTKLAPANWNWLGIISAHNALQRLQALIQKAAVLQPTRAQYVDFIAGWRMGINIYSRHTGPLAPHTFVQVWPQVTSLEENWLWVGAHTYHTGIQALNALVGKAKRRG